MRGGRAAAAAEDGDTVSPDGGETRSEIVGRALVEGAPVDDDGMPGIRHERERQLVRTKVANELLHLLRAVDAVKADGIDVSAARNGAHEVLDEPPVARIAARIGGERVEDERLWAFLLDMRRSLDQPLVGGIGLKYEVPRAEREECIGKKGVLVDDVRMRKPHDGTDVGKDIGVKGRRRARRDLPSGGDDAADELFIPLVDDAVRGECVGLNRLRPCAQILRVDVADDNRRLDICELDAFAARMQFLRVVCPHAAVKDKRRRFQIVP